MAEAQGLLFREKEAKSFCRRCRGSFRQRRTKETKFFGSLFKQELLALLYPLTPLARSTDPQTEECSIALDLLYLLTHIEEHAARFSNMSIHRRNVILASAMAAAGAVPSAKASVAASSTVELVKLRFKPGGRKIWEDWATELKEREIEVLQTLRNEGVSSEACFLSEDGEFVYYFTQVADRAKEEKAYAESRYPIDAEHKKKKEASLERVAVLNTLFAFQN